MTVVNVKEIRSEPPVLEAIQISINNVAEVSNWLGGYQADIHMKFDGTPTEITFRSTEETLRGAEGCWIVRDPSQAPSHFTITDANFKNRFQVLLNSGATNNEENN